ncbi:FG-GAP repeat domain-containing protein [Streptomyces sp. NPDC021012]|uniref:FG-GAP repeat domain-containing protein n=1 Tax=Streptomyces sp. NPDC021012 TaxID=3365107 RepID=UPI0037BDD88F
MDSRTARRRLSTAITAVLALTAGTALVAAPPAGAAPAPAPAAATAATAAAGNTANAQDVAELPVGAGVESVGPSGYLTGLSKFLWDRDTTSYEYRWHRPDGTSEFVVPPDSAWPEPNAAVSDIVPILNPYFDAIRLRDMSAPAGTAPVVFDLKKLSTPTLSYTYVTTIGSTPLVRVKPTGGPQELRLLTKPGDPGKKITGLPDDLDIVPKVRAAGDTALFQYRTGTTYRLFTVDLATATAGAERTTASSSFWIDADRMAWWQDETTLVVTDRATGTSKTIAFDPTVYPVAGLLGDWVVHGQRSTTGTAVGLVARPIAGGEPVKLLDSLSTVLPGPNGSLILQGGTIEHGKGVYRVTPGADGRPSAEQIASSGEGITLTLQKANVAPVVDLDPGHNSARLSWELSHGYFKADVTLVHKKSGQRFRYHYEDTRGWSGVDLAWPGNFASSRDEVGVNAYNGQYRWELDAEPTDGIGPDLHESGDFTVTRSPKVHDYNDNGSPDLLARGSDGVLFRTDTVYDQGKKKVLPVGDPTPVGSGWNYPQMESVGNVAGTTAPDVLGVDSAGSLWLHRGTGDEQNPLGARVKIGFGWQIYNKLAGGSDLTGDGRPDLLATDKAGGLYLYKATGDDAAPFAARKKIGTGWGIYNQITATGNIAGGTAGDLVARDKDGVLWLYLGKGDGTFAPRVKVGAGWNAYSQIAGIGDANRDGRSDLYVYGPDNTSYVYYGTGSWSAPFAARVPTDALTHTSIKYTNVL